MMIDITHKFKKMQSRLDSSKAVESIGEVVSVKGLVVESKGPEVGLGDLCKIYSKKEGIDVIAEVVGFRDNLIQLMTLQELGHIYPGCKISKLKRATRVPVGEGLLGRVIDGMGEPLDGKGDLKVDFEERLIARAPNPLSRKKIENQLSTGVKSIDTFIPVGIGQRLGIFSGSGVGKSTLLGMIARGAASDINVIVLIGERGREVREFIEDELGEEGLRKSIVIVSTSDQAAPLRLRAALLGTAIAEYFRDEGMDVLFMMDSITRLAMAQREIGLAIGEPPSSRGYTPSVFALLPKILERSGMGENGSITAFYNVLIEADDINDPISDAVRGILDGHIVLDRSLAAANHYPAISILDSLSRLQKGISSREEIKTVILARELLSTFKKNEDLINVGAYVSGVNAKIDQAIKKNDSLNDFLKQFPDELLDKSESIEELKKIMYEEV